MQIAGFFIFSIVLFILLTAAGFYTAKRLSQSFALKNSKIMIAIFLFANTSIILSNVIYRVFVLPLSAFYFIVSSWWMGAFIILIMVMLPFEIINIFYKIYNKKAGIAIVFLSILISAYATFQAFSMTVVPVTIKIKNVKNTLKIAHLSDMHVGVFRDMNYLQRVADSVNKLNVDAVFINGDLVDGKNDVKEDIFKPLANFNAPVYFIAGNHDYYAGLENIVSILKRLNVVFLFNQSVVIKGIQITGLDFMKADNKSTGIIPIKNKTIKEIMSEIKLDKKLPQVLFHHSPMGEQYIENAGIDLMVSGHTHGGQMFPMTILGKIGYVVNKGLGNYKNMQIYVSQGVGTFGPPMRLGTFGEITEITITGYNEPEFRNEVKR